MYVGCPCISSSVGCIPEIAVHTHNILLYRYEEYEVLAYEIIQILNNIDYAEQLASKGKETIQQKYPIESPLVDMALWYNQA